MCLVQETASFNVLYRYLDDVLTTQRVVLILECTFIVSIYVYCCEVFVFSFDKLWQRKESTNGKIVVRTTYPFGFSNDFFAAPRFHPFLWDVIMYLPTSNRWFVFPYATIMFSTGKL